MKKLSALLVLVLIGFLGKAQTINFPDLNFKTRLLAANPTVSIAVDALNNNIQIDTNNDGEIQQSEALLVVNLYLESSNISDLTGIEYFTNLDMLFAGDNQISSFTSTGLSNLFRLDLGYNNLTSISITNFSNLVELDLWHNQLTSITLNSLPNLWGIFCNSNNITSIDLSECIALEQIQFNENQLTSIVFPAYANTNVPSGPNFQLNGNLFETLTLPNHKIGGCNLSNNPNLKYLNVKESFYEDPGLTGDYFNSIYPFSNCPSLEYICVRDNDISIAQGMITSYGYTNCHVNSYCSFNPGGTYYTLQGNNSYDTDNNGCDSNDILVPNMKYTISNGFSTTTLVAGTDGSFHYDVSAGNYTITPIFENPLDYTANPASASVTFSGAGSSFTQNFCVTANSVHNDLEITLIPIGGVRPGFDADYKIIYKNKGTTTQSGTVNLSYDDTILELVSASPTISSQVTDNLTWNFSNLLPFETREILVTLNLNSPLETPPVNAGNWILYTATVTGATDETPDDNTSTLTQTVVNSFDPNDKTCLEGASLPTYEVGNYVHYIIRFENTGTANAENIVVKDMIDTTKFDVNSLIPLSGSHSYVTRIMTTNKVEFIFENINLPFNDANNDGYVAFKIKTLPTLVEFNTFSNSASIYFDYNAPIVTDPYVTTVFNPLGLLDFDFNSMFTLSPVPTKNNLTITTKLDMIMSSVNIYNTLGQVVQVITEPNQTIDVSGLTAGSYFIKIISDKGSANSTFIKE